MQSLNRLVAYCLAGLAVAGCSDNGIVAPGGHPLPAGLGLKLDPFITSGLSSPVFLTQPLNDGRIFIVEQGGRIRIFRNGALVATPFLDITGRVLSGGERGLLSVAFHPQYATNHFFYVYFTSQPSGDIRIERYVATSADVADPASNTLILGIAHSEFPNHNGGLLTFGPDGMLYAGVGDGGNGGDPHGNGQNFNALLGSLLRLDVNRPPPFIPQDNPFVNQTGKRGEIWAKGLRNPWRWAFDPPTGLFYMADVGQNLHEEVDVVAASRAGVNYGWNIMEASSCFNPSSGCTQTGLELPVIDYAHAGGACSITGGYVYRGSAIPAIVGHYFYSDFCAGFLRSFRFQNGGAVDQKDWNLTMPAVVSFGLDFAGELYMISGNSVFKLAQAT